MRTDLAELLHERRGHFEFESGHHGDRWLELERLFERPRAVRPLVRELAEKVAGLEPEVICGPMVEGAFVGLMVAEKLGLEFVYAERFVEGAEVRYRLPEAVRQTVSGRRVVVANDVINAGSAVGGALGDLAACGAQAVGIATLLALGEGAAELAARRGVGLEMLAGEPANIWSPGECPLCAAGEAVTPHPGS